MNRFAALFAALDGTTRTSAKVAALADYFRAAPEADRVWTVALLSGRRPKRSVGAGRLAEWAAARAGIPLWLFEECYAVAGDLAETIALVLPPPAGPGSPSAGQSHGHASNQPLQHTPEHAPGNAPGNAHAHAHACDPAPRAPPGHSLAHWLAEVRTLASLPEAEKRPRIEAAWDALDGSERFLFNKLLTGGFRMGVSQGLMTRALAQATGQAEADLAHRLMGDWDPAQTPWAALVAADPAADLSRPYPFQLAHQIDVAPEDLGPPGDWLAEWKWDGIRGQLVVRGGTRFLWSRGEELVTDRFPELATLPDFLPPGTVIDGEVLAFAEGRPLPFAALQRRIGRKTVPKAVLAAAPAAMLAYDLLEDGGADIRARPLADRRARLAALIADLPPGLPLMLSPEVAFPGWADLTAERARARDRGAEGLMLKRRAAPYVAGRHKGDWWKWKVDPLTIDAVMVYAQAGHGRRANLYTDYTFAVRDGADFVPFTKAYSGLTDAEFAEITRWVRANTLERYGPVRRVTPDLVFEIGFEGIQASPRHKSGVALRFPRMIRWRQDKPAAEANTLDDLRAMLAAFG